MIWRADGRRKIGKGSHDRWWSAAVGSGEMLCDSRYTGFVRVDVQYLVLHQILLQMQKDASEWGFQR